MPITAIIPTFNEEENIERALTSVQFCDEVLVVDSFSTDGTVEMAKRMGAKVIQRAYGYSASQKNWAIPQATHPWIVLLDADEWLDDKTQKIIAETMAAKPSEAAFWLPRYNLFMGKRMRYGGWKNDKVIRLFQRDKCRYEDKRVHAEIICDGAVGSLNGTIGHNTYRGFSEMIRKTDRYTSWAAVDRANKRRVGWIDFTLKPWFAFFRDYILKLGFLDGKRGFISATHTGWSKFIRAVKIWRIQMGETLTDPETKQPIDKS